MDKVKYTTRNEELLRIKSNKRDKYKNLFRNFDHSDEDTIVLTATEFLLIANLLHLNANYIIVFLEMVLYHDTISTCVMYVLLVSILGVPISMLVNFMSSYATRSYLKFWESVPVFEGLGYSLSIIRLSDEVFNVIHAGVTLVYLWRVQTPDFKDVVTSCSFAEDTEYEECIVRDVYAVHNCSDDLETVTPTQLYYRKIITRFMFHDEVDWPSVNMEWMWGILISWILIFCLAIIGLRRMKQFMINVQIFSSVTILALSLITAFMVDTSDIVDTSEYENPLTKLDFWVSVILHAAEINVLSNMIWIGTMKPPALHPKFAALVMPPIKMVVFIFLLGIMSIARRDNALYYKFQDLKCLSVLTAEEVLFVLLPDIFLRHRTWRFTLSLWYISLYAFMILPPIYSVIGMLMSIEEHFPKTKRFRVLSCFVICSLAFLFSLPLISEVGNLIIVLWRLCGLTVLTASLMLVVNVAIFFIYTAEQIINDYTFVYGVPPETYWTSLWKCCPIFSIFVFLFAITCQTILAGLSEGNDTYIMMGSYIYAAVALSPICILAVVKFCKHVQTRSLEKLIRPCADWGPKNEKMRTARRNFYPQRNVRFRNHTVVCKHKCSVSNVSMYADELMLQKRRYRAFRSSFT